METDIDPLSTEYNATFDNNQVAEKPSDSDVQENAEQIVTESPVKVEHKEKSQEYIKLEIPLANATENVFTPDDIATLTDEEPLSEIKLKVPKKEKKLKKNKTKTKKFKPDNGPKRGKKQWQRRKLYTSAYEDENGIPFYGCSVCDVKFTSLLTLQIHVTEHKDRVTSWDLRVKNQQLKKKHRKEKKKLKKVKIEGVKEEGIKTEVECELPLEVELSLPLPSEVGLPLNLNEFVKNLTKMADDNEAVNISTLSVSESGNVISTSNITNVTELSASTNWNETVVTTAVVNNTETEPVNTSSVNEETSNNETIENGVNGNSSTEPVDKEAENLEKIFKCGVCSKQFSLGYYLKLHVRSHTGEKPYHCETCGLTFITASKLGRHRKRMHLSIKFECRICHKIYTRLEFLARHFNKYHAEDKIEGELYDYNAILPYLKELQEELERKKEIERALKKECDDLFGPLPELAETKPKREATWSVNMDDIKMEPADVKQEIKTEVDPDAEPEPDVWLPDALPEVYQDDYNEPEVPPPEAAPVFKDEDVSDDEDYFPDNTWLPAPTPRPEPGEKRATRRHRTKNDGPLECEICHKQIRTQSYMRIHLRTHSGERPHKCPLCGKGFITASKLNRHVLTHADWDSQIDGKKPLGNVKEEATSDKDENEPSKKKGEVKRRKRKLLAPKTEGEEGEGGSKRRTKRPHACTHCNKKFLHLNALEAHSRQHSGSPPPPCCRYCELRLSDEGERGEHEARHVGARPYQCTLCGNTYKKRESMIYHKRNHTSEKKFQCDVCPKSFNALCKLQRHLMSHRPDKYVVRYECPVCAHIFNTKYHVEMHLGTHEKEGVILQENRGAVLAMVMQNARKIPLEPDPTSSLHEPPKDERSRICNICGEIFEHFFYLEQHLKTHGSKFSIETSQEEKADTRKHVCPVCHKGFKLSYYLKLHSFTHTKEKPFICQQCGKGFITKGKLKRHLETHAGLKKYQCHICCKFFTRPSYLRIHVRTIHGHQDYNFKSDMDFDLSLPLQAMSHDSV